LHDYKPDYDSQIDRAISRRNRETNWNDRELRQGNKVMDKYVHGGYDVEDVGDAWSDLHHESKKPMKVTEEKIKAIISESIKHYIREGYWDDETDPIKLAEMYKECVVRFDNAIKAAIKQRGGLENIREGEVILEISSRGWRYWDSEHKALEALSDKYYRCPWRKDSAKTNIRCFQRNHSANNRVEYIFVKGNEKPSNLWGDISRGW